MAYLGILSKRRPQIAIGRRVVQCVGHGSRSQLQQLLIAHRQGAAQGSVNPVSLLLPRPPADTRGIRGRFLSRPVGAREGPRDFRQVTAQLLCLLLQIQPQPPARFDGPGSYGIECGISCARLRYSLRAGQCRQWHRVGEEQRSGRALQELAAVDSRGGIPAVRSRALDGAQASCAAQAISGSGHSNICPTLVVPRTETTSCDSTSCTGDS